MHRLSLLFVFPAAAHAIIKKIRRLLQHAEMSGFWIVKSRLFLLRWSYLKSKRNAVSPTNAVFLRRKGIESGGCAQPGRRVSLFCRLSGAGKLTFNGHVGALSYSYRFIALSWPTGRPRDNPGRWFRPECHSCLSWKQFFHNFSTNWWNVSSFSSRRSACHSKWN